MPIYEYRCSNGHLFEVQQSMSDDPIAVCEVCGVGVERVFHPVAVHFKGSGFYTTDYGRKRSGAGVGASDLASGDSGNGAKDDSGGAQGESGKGERAKSDSGGARGESVKKTDSKSD